MKVFFRNLGIGVFLAAGTVLINHALGFNTSRHDIGEISRNAVIVVLWCAIFVTIVQMRALAGDEHNFLSAFRNGFLYSVFFSGAYALFMAFYQHFIHPQFYATYRAYFAGKPAVAKLAPEVLAATMRQFDMNYKGDFPTYILLFLATGMGGVILSAIAAALYRKPRKASP
ncbi:MAG: DUF4199 domain-containing protein [Spirochaetes bacterium]|nr:DUF4199 domain-containing protein [Spirochaetota bacterium]